MHLWRKIYGSTTISSGKAWETTTMMLATVTFLWTARWADRIKDWLTWGDSLEDRSAISYEKAIKKHKKAIYIFYA